MATYTGNGGYVYEQLADGAYKIIKSPRSGGGQIIRQDSPVWSYIHAELKDLTPNEDMRGSDGQSMVSSSKYSRGRAANATLEDARAEAAKAASSKDTSPMAMAMEKSKSSPGGTTPGSNIQFKKPSESDFSEMAKQVEASQNQKPMTLAEKATELPMGIRVAEVADSISRRSPDKKVVEMASNLPDYAPPKGKEEGKKPNTTASAGHLAELLWGIK